MRASSKAYRDEHHMAFMRDIGGHARICAKPSHVSLPGWHVAGTGSDAASVIHVKDGKPLTEHGARLLGVEWKP